MANKIDRREFLALMGMGGAAATVGCGSAPNFDETWKPWVSPVAGTIPYVPNYYATTTHESGGAGLWVKVLGGRATKLEGNPKHPINAGTLTARQQAVIQGLYGTGRLTEPVGKSEGNMTWRDFDAKLKSLLEANKGKNIYTLTGQVSGAEAEIWTRFCAEMGTGRHVTYSPYCDSDMVLASEKVFGVQAAPRWSLAGAKFVLCLGAQFLETWGDVTANMRDHADMRTVEHGERGVHIQLEARVSMTGANADEVLPARPGSKTLIALALLKELAAHSPTLAADDQAKIATLTANASLEQAASASGLAAEKLAHLAEELLKKPSLVLPAERLELSGDSVTHHAAVLLINKVLGAVGKHVNYAAGRPIEHTSDHRGIVDLIKDLNDGKVDLLLIHGTNPAYSLPAALEFAKALAKTTSIAFAASQDETTALASYAVASRHDLESWGEVNTYKGIDMLMQPVMTPRWLCRQVHDYLIEGIRAVNPDALPQENFRDFLKASWTTRFGTGADPEKFWRDSLKTGGLFSVPEGADMPLSGNIGADFFASVAEPDEQAMSLVIVDSARFGDGSGTDSGWLHELPDAMSGVVWDSWLEMSHKTAHDLNIQYKSGLKGGHTQMVEVKANGLTLELPAFIVETIGDNLVTLATGQGHEGLSKLYNRGANAFKFLGSELDEGGQLSVGPQSAELTRKDSGYRIATFHVPGLGDKMVTPLSSHVLKPVTMLEHSEVKRDLFQKIALADVGHDTGHGGGGHHEVLSVDSNYPLHTDVDWYPERTADPVYKDRDETFYDDYKWELSFDLNRCNGCGSCVTACFAENNLPVVGKDQVAKGREMSWVRINRYLEKAEHGQLPKVRAMPMMCQQCANAPCEAVCPSLATYHSKEGLNAMVYNRCVGTRYCANNCSYKVRRFNWFSFEWEGDLNWALNPSVSVRQMGVMEKCTFCVQRIRDGKDAARDKGRKALDGEVQTACQQACPAGAVRFGNHEDKKSKVYQWASDSRAYRALDSHIRTKPGVTYLKRVVLENEHHG